MPPTPQLRYLTAAFLIIASSAAVAGINKCTDASGVITYSDQPCAVKGQQAAEVKNDVEFAQLAARERQQNLGQTCTMLTERRSQCRQYGDSRLNALFNESCELPIKRAARQRQEEQYRQSRNGRSSQIRNDALDDKPRPQVACSTLDEEMYKFVKENFAAKISPEDAKAIEYKLMAVPSDGKERPLTTKARRRD